MGITSIREVQWKKSFNLWRIKIGALLKEQGMEVLVSKSVSHIYKHVLEQHEDNA